MHEAPFCNFIVLATVLFSRHIWVEKQITLLYLLLTNNMAVSSQQFLYTHDTSTTLLLCNLCEELHMLKEGWNLPFLLLSFTEKKNIVLHSFLIIMLNLFQFITDLHSWLLLCLFIRSLKIHRPDEYGYVFPYTVAFTHWTYLVNCIACNGIIESIYM